MVTDSDVQPRKLGFLAPSRSVEAENIGGSGITVFVISANKGAVSRD